MFEYLTGELVEKTPAYSIISNGGIAFRVLTPLSTYESLPDKGKVKIFTELYLASSVQDNVVRLYGFATLEERKLFQLLCTVQRVGPNTALRILSGTSVREFRQAVLSENIRYLEKIKGVGTKTAQRIILELKESLSNLMPQPSDNVITSDENTLITDAILSLVKLGYPRLSAEHVVREVTKTLDPNFTTEDLVKKALQKI